MIAFFWAIHLNIFGQPDYFRHYKVENGLSNNAVMCSLQDKYGFLWFGTKDGLNRFDGYTFKVFRSYDSVPGSIGNNFILALHEDKNGSLWIGTVKGVYKYDALSESFSTSKSFAEMPVEEITSDGEGNLWFASNFSLYRFSEKQNKLTPFAREKYFHVSTICSTPDGNIWAATTDGLLKRYNQKNNSFTSFDVFEHSRPPAFRWIEQIYSTNNGYILIGTGVAGAKIFDTKQLTCKNISTDSKKSSDLFVRNFLQISTNEFWMGTEAGVFIYNTQTAKTIKLTKKYGDPFTLSDNAIYTFCRDKEGGVWIGTYFGGINYYPKQYTPFKKIYPKTGENALVGNVVREMTKDHYGNLWIGTEDAGLNKLEKATGKFTQFLPTGSENSISYPNIHGLLLHGDELWIGTFEHGLDIMNIKTGKVVRRYRSPGFGLKSNFIYCLYKTNSGEILVGTTIGIYKYNPETDFFDTLPGMQVYNWYTSIIKDEDGIIWAGTYGNGLKYYDTKTGKTGMYGHSAADKKSLASDRVNSLFYDGGKTLWVATENGLCRWNPAEKTFSLYNTSNGFPSNFIISILEDERNQLWISTTKGLVCFHPKSEKIQVYGSSNGLLSDQFNFNSAYKDTDGRMFFGSANGLISFDPKEFAQDTFIPPVYLTGIQINNQEITVNKKGSPLTQSISYTGKLSLNHNQSTLSIDFAALSYTAPYMIEYAYQLEGLSKGWTYLKTNRKVYFTELPPGMYTFKVKASNSSGIWDSKETKLIIEVLPPWWASRWAYALYFIVALLLFYYLVHSYHARIRERNRKHVELLEIAKEKELFKAKIEFFANVAHEIKTPLTLIKIPLKKVIKKTAEISEIKNSLRIIDNNTNRLIELTNQLLDFRQTEINGFNLSFVKANISELLNEACLNFTTLAEQKSINLSFNPSNGPLYAFVDIEAFNKIVYNLLSNAVKYAHAHVEIYIIRCFKNETSFSILIKNDGYLIPPHLKEKIFEPFYRIKENKIEKGTGIGLAIALSLTQLHGGVLLLEEPENNMNVFSLTLPIHQDKKLNLLNNHQTNPTDKP